MTRRARRTPTEPSNRRSIPRFANEDDERAFWEKAESTDYVDWKQAARVRLPELKPSTATISLRLPEALLEDLETLAHERDVPYQSLLKMFLADRIQEERRRRRSA